MASVDVGGVHACTGVLVNPQWVLTARSCFAIDGRPVTAGAPPAATTVTIGRPDLSSSAGRVLAAVAIVPHPDRDVVLVKLAVRVLEITPVAVAGTGPIAGDVAQVAGYGRTSSEWVPGRLHAAPATVQAVAADTFTWVGSGTARTTACRGDAGGPVVRSADGKPELVGLDIASGRDGCLAESDTPPGTTAARVDDLKAWIAQHTPGLTAAFGPVYSGQSGIGSYDLNSTADQVVPFDYDHSGKLDHLVMYRPGMGVVYILKHGAGNSFSPVFSSGSGIGGYDLASPSDRIVAFDYDHSGKLDHLLLYRPGMGIVYILKHGAGNSFSPVFSSGSGIGGYDLADVRDQVVALDYQHTGKQDHLVMYRPGMGIVYILQHGAGNSFSPVFSSGSGIGGYDLASPSDRIVPFDYGHTGKQDHLVMYRPGRGIVWILQHGAGNSFSPAFSSASGIGGYDLTDVRDQIVAYDYQHTGRLDHLVMYRPGWRAVYILERRTGNVFAPVYSTITAGIGSYDLTNDRDRIVAFDYEHAGAPNYLLLYRPGMGSVWIVGRELATPPAAASTSSVSTVAAVDAETSIVEDYSYPGAAEILDTQQLKLIKGDGHLLLADCGTGNPAAGLIVVETHNPDLGYPRYCFAATGTSGYLTMEVPQVFLIRGDQSHTVEATLAVVGEPGAVTEEVSPQEWESVGIGQNDGEATLLEIRYPFTA